MNIVLIGPHGAGKSTQALRLAQAYRLPHISLGSLLRALASARLETDPSLQSRLERGDYLPDNEVVPFLAARLQQPDVRSGFVLEGFPRTIAQAKSLPFQPDVVFALHLSDDASAQRLLARRRHDDTPALIAHRLEQHHRDEAKILAYFKDEDKLQIIPADASVDSVTADIRGRIDAWQGHHD